VVRNPRKIPRLMRFGKQSQMAAEKLVEFLNHFIAMLATGQESLPNKAVT